jgi:uncharacterized membrane protein
MGILILGIVVFLGAHTFTTFREARAGLVARIGQNAYRGLFSVVSLIGFALIAWGFHRYRADGWVQVWYPPAGMRHLTMLLMWLAFVAFASGLAGPGRIRGWVRHPMVTALKTWALAHLLVNGDLGGMILFGAFLAWGVFDRIALKRRGDAGAPRLAAFTRGDAIALIGGTIAYAAMILLHPILIGVPILG